MSKILWSVKSLLYGGKIAYVVSLFFLLYFVYFSIKYRPESDKLMRIIYPLNNERVPKVLPEVRKNRGIAQFLIPEIKNMSSFEDDLPIASQKSDQDNSKDVNLMAHQNAESFNSPTKSKNNAKKELLQKMGESPLIEFLYSPMFTLTPNLLKKHEKPKRIIEKELNDFEIYLSDMRILLFFSIMMCLGLDKFILVVYIIRGRFPQDLLLLYTMHSLSFIFLFLNLMVNEDLIIFTNLFTKYCKIFFLGIVVSNSLLFLVLIMGFLVVTILFVCFPQLQNRIRQRIARYDMLIEQMAENNGFVNDFEENQPLTEEELQELNSFVKTDSFIDIYNAPDKTGKSATDWEAEYHELENQDEDINNILIDLDR